jgi:hypothetical protein
MEYRAVCRSAGHDYGRDTVVFQYLLKPRVDKFVGPGLNEGLFAIGGDIGNSIANVAVGDNA